MSRLDIEGLDGVLGGVSEKASPEDTAAVASSRSGIAQVELVGDIDEEIPFGFETAEPVARGPNVYEEEQEPPTDPQVAAPSPMVTTTPMPDLEMDLPEPIDLDDEGPNVARRVFMLAVVTILLTGLGTWAFQKVSSMRSASSAEIEPPTFPVAISPQGLEQPTEAEALPQFDPGSDESVAAIMSSPEAQALQAELEAAAAQRAADSLAAEQAELESAAQLAEEEANRLLDEQEAASRFAAEASAEEARLEALRVAAVAAQEVEEAQRIAEDQAAAALAARIAATEAAAAARRQRAADRHAEAAQLANPTIAEIVEETADEALQAVPPVTSRTTSNIPTPTVESAPTATPTIEDMSAGQSSDTYGLRTPIAAIPDTLPAPSTVAPPGANNYSAQFPAAFTYNNNAMRVTNSAQAMAIINAIIASPGPIRVVGHTDSTGSATMNLRLGWLRANTVRKFLIQSGVDENRITVESAGSSQPITTNETREGRELNRRVMLIYPRANR